MEKLKELLEKLEDSRKKMNSLVDNAEKENRDLNDEERKMFDQYASECEEINKKVEAEQRRIKINSINTGIPNEGPVSDKAKKEMEAKAKKEKEIKAFASYVKSFIGGVSDDASNAMTRSNNSAVIPETIVNMIVDKVKELSPLYKDSQTFKGKGKVKIPYVDETNDNIAAEYVTEGEADDPKDSTLKTVDLDEYLVRAMTDVSNSLINNTDLDIVKFVVGKIAASFAFRYDMTMLGRDAEKGPKGISGAKNIVEVASSDALTTDDILTLVTSLPSIYGNDAYMVMNKLTLQMILKMKDKNGRYMFIDSNTGRFGHQLFGTDVYLSDAAEKLEAGKTAITFVNPAYALAKHVTEDYEIKPLTEKYYAQHITEFVAFSSFDARIQNQQAIAVLKLKAAS